MLRSSDKKKRSDVVQLHNCRMYLDLHDEEINGSDSANTARVWTGSRRAITWLSDSNVDWREQERSIAAITA